MRISVVLAILACAPASAQESTDPIHIALTDRTAGQIAAVLMGQVLTEGGYRVAYVSTAPVDIMAALGSGAVDLAVHVPENVFQAPDAAGLADAVSMTGLSGADDWWIPAYMQPACPYLPDWLDLADPACAAAFATDTTAPAGRLLAGPENWGGADAARIVALGLPFVVERVATEAELWAALDAATAAQAPIILSVPAAHWVPGAYEGMYIGLPLWEPACDNDPRWGDNPDATGDCAGPWGGSWTLTAPAFGENWAGAAATVSAFFLSNADMAALTAQVDRDGATVDDAVTGWMAANPDIWRGWIGQ